MAWSPQARKAAALARKRKSGGRAKPQFGVGRNGKPMSAAQRKKAGIKRGQTAPKAKSRPKSKSSFGKRRLTKKINKNNKRISRLQSGIKKDFKPGSPAYGSGLHHSVERRLAKRQRQNAKYKGKLAKKRK